MEIDLRLSFYVMGTNSIAHGRLNLTENLSLFTLNYCELEICYVSTLNQATFLDKEKKKSSLFSGYGSKT